jgi:RHS repeat-associated protein
MFDPTMLLNGIAQIQLSATDQSGQTSTTVVDVLVTRNVKVGNFTLAFTDLNIPVAGIPIQVIRTYDSRIKASGDFGFGWSLSYNTIKTQVNGLLGNDWFMTSDGGFLPNYCVQFQGNEKVSVRLQDGTVYQFQPTATSATQCQQVQPPQTVDIAFVPIGATPASAKLSDSTGAGVGLFVSATGGGFPGPIQLIDINTGASYDPQAFILTLPNGQQLAVDRTAGLTSVTDTNNNTLTFTAGGIIATPSGKSVTFTRDGQNRITQINDPSGNTIKYAYDANGDLVTFTDQLNNVSTFSYDGAHDLLSFKDPNGNQPIRNIYDDSGRLIQVIDAFGHVTNVSHDVVASTDTVTDALGNTTTYFYDSSGDITQITDALGGITKSTFDSNGNKLSRTNALGQTSSFTYDSSNNRLTETDPLGHTTQYSFNPNNKPLTTADRLGHVTTNAYDTNGNLTNTADALGTITSNAFLSNGQLQSTTNAAGDSTSYTYDASGNLLTQTDATGVVTTYTYDANGNRLTKAVTRTTSGGPQTLTTQFQYDARNNLIKTTFPDSSTSQSTYNASGRRTSTTDGRGLLTTYQYDAEGRLALTSYPDGTQESASYDANGNMIAASDRSGRVTTYTYDSLNRLAKTTLPDGSFTTTVYDAVGEITSFTDANGNTTQYTYDAAGRRTSVTDPLSHTTTINYDALGQQVSRTDANGHITQYIYDVRGRRTKVTFADGNFETTTYDALGRVIARADANGKITQDAYDKLGRLTKVTDALGQVTSFAYDEVGERISQADANGHSTTYEYDQLGRRVQRKLPLGQTEAYSYDADGNLVSRTDFNGHTTTYAYDLANKLLSKTADSFFAVNHIGAAAVTYTYTPTGKRSSMTDASGVTTYTYDSRDHLISKNTPRGVLSYTYDAEGDVKTIQSSNPGGSNLTYSYDARNRLLTVTDANGSSSYSYDNVGNLASIIYPTSVTHTFAYDSRNRLTNLSVTKGVSLETYAYSLDAAGHRLGVTELSGRTVAYGYDSLYRLTNETVGADPSGVNGALSYTYDPVGNRTQLTSTLAPVPGGLWNYNANDQLTTDSYDSNGSTIGSGGSSYAYDFENHLVQGGAISIVYDGDGNRVSKTVSGVTTSYLIDTLNPTGYPQVVEELQAGAIVRTYTWGLQLISQSRAQVSPNPPVVSYYVFDGQGSVRALTSGTGAITDTYDYDAFGNLVNKTGTTPNNYLYTGEQYDPDLHFYYLRARYLNTSSGRFLTLDAYEGDPGAPSSLHKYLYTGDDPVGRRDPSGRQFADFVLGISIEISIFAAEVAPYAYLIAFIAGAIYIATGIVIAVDETITGNQANDFLYTLRDGAGDLFFMAYFVGDAAQSLAMVGPGARKPTSDDAPVKTIQVSRSRYPLSAQHIDDAQAAGHPSILTVDRSNAAQNRAASLQGYATAPGLDRDEYPPAVFAEGGEGASVQYVPPSDNRGAGASIGNQLRGVPDGAKVQVVTVP